MKNALTVFIAVLAGLLTACDQNANSQQGEADFTNQELLKALGGASYVRTLPDDLTPSDSVFLAFLESDGTTRKISGGTGYNPGEKVKIFVLGSISKPDVAVLAQGHSFRTTLTTESEGRSAGDSYGAYDLPIVIFTRDNEISHTDAPQDDDFALILHIQKATDSEQNP